MTFTTSSSASLSQTAETSYFYRQGEIHSDEFNKLCISSENSLSEEQINVFHRILDCVSNTAAAEMRAAYKVGFKDGIELMKEVLE